MKWYQIWWHVWTHPGAEAFRTILRDSQASAKRGFVWIAATSVISYMANVLSITFGGNELAVEFRYLVRVFINAPLVGIIVLAISAGIYRFIAGLFGGSGTWGKLVYCFAVISAPASLLATPSVFLAPFLTDASTTNSLLLPVDCLVSLIDFAVGIYTIVLFVFAIDAVENTGTRKAVLIYFIPVLGGIALVICLIMVGIIQ